MPETVSSARSDPAAAGPSARNRLNLIEQLRQDAVATDYGAERAPGHQPAGIRRQQFVVAATALGLAGFVLALGVSARLTNTPALSGQRQALIERIDTADSQLAATTAEVALLRSEAGRQRENSLTLSTEGQRLDERISDLALVTGYLAVQGSGAVVTLSDAPTDEPPLAEDGGDPDLERVLDSDVQLTVNGLWAAGAEAVAVNGQRLTSQSAIRSAAGAILVNYRPLKPPYLVTAIGPNDLDERFAATPDATKLQSLSEQFGIGWQVSSADGLTLRPATTPLPTEATVVAAEEGAVQ